MLQTSFGASCRNRASVFEWHKRFKQGKESVRDDEKFGRSKEVNTPELIGKKGLGLVLWCWGFKGFQEDIPSEEASTLQIGSVAFLPEQYTSPQLHPCQPPYCLDLAPCDFWLSLSSEAVVMKQMRRWKRLWRRSLTRAHKRISMGPSRRCWYGTTSALHPEEITLKGTRVSCLYSQ